MSSQVKYVGLNQRWITVGSKDIEYRSKKTVDKVEVRVNEASNKELSRHSKRSFSYREGSDKRFLSFQILKDPLFLHPPYLI